MSTGKEDNENSRHLPIAGTFAHQDINKLSGRTRIVDK